MAKAGLKEVDTYALRRHNTVAQYIATGPIMDLCMAAKRRPGPRVAIRRWKYEGFDLKADQTVR